MDNVIFTVTRMLAFLHWKPSTYGYSYLALILVFTYIYHKLPNDFFQSTDSFEGSALASKAVLENSIQAIVNHNVSKVCRANPGSGIISRGTKFMACGTTAEAQFAHLRDDSLRVYLRMSTRSAGEMFAQDFIIDSTLELRKLPSENKSAEVYDYTVSLIDGINVFSNAPIGKASEEKEHPYQTNQRILQMMLNLGMSEENIEELGISVSEIRSIAEQASRSQGPHTRDLVLPLGFGCDSKQCTLKLSKVTNDAIEKLLFGERTGFMNPDGLPLRMFYFSVVTQTTLGYGDIVPISERARTFVAIQSLLGVIVIGLFLNAAGSAVSKLV